MYVNSSLRQPLMSYQWCSTCGSSQCSHSSHSSSLKQHLNRFALNEMSNATLSVPLSSPAVSAANTMFTPISAYHSYGSQMSANNSFATYPPYSNWSPLESPQASSLLTNTLRPSVSTDANHTNFARCPINANKYKDANLQTLAANIEAIKNRNEQFERNVLSQLRDMKEVLVELKTAVNELPNKFADALAASLASLPRRSRSVSIDSEIELIDSMSAITVTSNKDFIGFTPLSPNELNERQSFDEQIEVENEKRETRNEENVVNKNVSYSQSVSEKFVFEYNPDLDLDKWLKKD